MKWKGLIICNRSYHVLSSSELDGETRSCTRLPGNGSENARNTERMNEKMRMAEIESKLC